MDFLDHLPPCTPSADATGRVDIGEFSFDLNWSGTLALLLSIGLFVSIVMAGSVFFVSAAGATQPSNPVMDSGPSNAVDSPAFSTIPKRDNGSPSEDKGTGDGRAGDSEAGSSSDKSSKNSDRSDGSSSDNADSSSGGDDQSSSSDKSSKDDDKSDDSSNNGGNSGDDSSDSKDGKTSKGDDNSGGKDSSESSDDNSDSADDNSDDSSNGNDQSGNSDEKSGGNDQSSSSNGDSGGDGDSSSSNQQSTGSNGQDAESSNADGSDGGSDEEDTKTNTEDDNEDSSSQDSDSSSDSDDNADDGDTSNSKSGSSGKSNSNDDKGKNSDDSSEKPDADQDKGDEKQASTEDNGNGQGPNTNANENAGDRGANSEERGANAAHRSDNNRGQGPHFLIAGMPGDGISVAMDVADSNASLGPFDEFEQSGDSNASANDETEETSTVNVSVTGVEEGETVTLHVASQETRDDAVAFDSITATVKKSGSLTFTITSTLEPLPGSPEFSLNDGTDSIARIRLDHSISNDDVEDVSIKFRVSKARLRATDTDIEDVVLYRYGEGSWSGLDTEPIGETKTHYIFKVDSPGMSEFAVGAQRPKFNLWHAEATTNSISNEDPATIRTRVTNIGGADGVFTARVLLDGQVVEQKEITIASGGTRQGTFRLTINRPGTYRVRINDASAGTITVEATAVPAREVETAGARSQFPVGEVASIRSLFDRAADLAPGINTASIPIPVSKLLL